MEDLTREFLNKEFPVDENIESIDQVRDKYGFVNLRATPGEGNLSEKEIAQYIDQVIRAENEFFGRFSTPIKFNDHPDDAEPCES